MSQVASTQRTLWPLLHSPSPVTWPAEALGLRVPLSAPLGAPLRVPSRVPLGAPLRVPSRIPLKCPLGAPLWVPLRVLQGLTVEGLEFRVRALGTLEYKTTDPALNYCLALLMGLDFLAALLGTFAVSSGV